jgi:SAM-dependent methyltransferase
MIQLPQEQHNLEIHQNLEYWDKKPVLRKIYRKFYELISKQIDNKLTGKIVEVGSGIGNLKSIVPQAICTDLFDNPWIDQVENAYKLTFKKDSISNLILFDVFHHLEYPACALAEFKRVLAKGGRIIIFEPAVSLLGILVYGIFHQEPLALRKKILWEVPTDFDPSKTIYYAAQSNASRIFFKRKYKKYLGDWKVITRKRLSSAAYVCSGGYSKPQLYPDFLLPVINFIDRLLSIIPFLFATRLLIVLEKK